MKKGMRIVALILALALVLSASAAFADAYTVPKTLKGVEGLPENPEVPTMTTKNDGHTEKVTVIGDVKALYANWNNELVPLELVDGVATFSIDGHIVQLGMAAKHNSWTTYGNTHMEYYKPYGGWYSRPVRKDGYKSEITLPAAYEMRESWSDGGYIDHRIPYVDVRLPGYYYDIPGAIYVPEPEPEPVEPVVVPTEEEIKAREAFWEWQEEYQKDWTGWSARAEELIKDLVYTGDYSNKSYTNWSGYNYIASMERDGKTESEIQKILDDALTALGTKEYLNRGTYFGGYDPEGEVRGLEISKLTRFWAEDIKGFGDAFEAELEGNIIARYNRKGEVCEKEILLEGVDFFASEKAPSKVSVVWSKGKNMYNKTVWYVSSIGQIYDDVMVMATFAQNGQRIKVKSAEVPATQAATVEDVK